MTLRKIDGTTLIAWQHFTRTANWSDFQRLDEFRYVSFAVQACRAGYDVQGHVERLLGATDCDPTLSKKLVEWARIIELTMFAVPLIENEAVGPVAV
jgi:hypothetical protein